MTKQGKIVNNDVNMSKFSFSETLILSSFIKHFLFKWGRSVTKFGHACMVFQ